MRLPLRMSAVLLASSLLFSVAQAQDKLDTPTIRLVGSTPTSLTVEVQAGASGAPAGFRVAWMKLSDFIANGGWPSDLNSPLLSRAQFYGNPTWNVSTGSYKLDRGQTVQFEMGDFFDETGLLANNVGELTDQQQYVVHVQAVGTPLAQASDQSNDLQSATAPASQNCTFTLGYWKNHSSAWPVTSLMLGTVTYTQAQLLQILNAPANGNGLISLAHQLIAAKLNLANGADPTAIASTIATADGLIGGLVVPPIGGGFLAPGTTDATGHTLDQFNNGLLGPGHCGETRAKPATWGTLKGMYR